MAAEPFLHETSNRAITAKGRYGGTKTQQQNKKDCCGVTPVFDLGRCCNVKHVPRCVYAGARK